MITRAVYRGVLFLTLAGAGLRAGEITLGNPPMQQTGNCDPFGCPQFLGLGTYQQVYLDSAFPGPITIDELSFFQGQITGGVLPSGTYSLSFSYTPYAPGDLNLTNPNLNVGSGSQSFFSGTLPPLTSEGGGTDELIIPGTPFVYNPADGNLLLTVQVSGAVDGDRRVFFNEAQCGPQTVCPAGVDVVSGDAYFGVANGGNAQGGLVTGFTYTTELATPEPAPFLLTAAGLVLIGLMVRRLA